MTVKKKKVLICRCGPSVNVLLIYCVFVLIYPTFSCCEGSHIEGSSFIFFHYSFPLRTVGPAAVASDSSG